MLKITPYFTMNCKVVNTFRSFLFLIYLFFLNSDVKSQVTTFLYTGTYQTYTVPNGVSLITIECSGAQGGNGNDLGFNGFGGKGGYVKGDLAVTPGQILYVNVGGKGINGTGSDNKLSGGFNGGGDGYNGNGYESGSGGGASDVRKSDNNISSRFIVAGGGGGGGGGVGFGAVGGGGGYPKGGDGSGTSRDGGGGTQSSGGVSGSNSCPNGNGVIFQGGNGICYVDPGGGGGWYGGGEGYNAGGGSSYIDGVTNSSYINGSQTGNGLVIITINCTNTTNTTTKIACDTYTWSVNGTTYTSSGTYSATITNAGGCNDVETLVLTINNSPTTPTYNVTPPTCATPTGTISIQLQSGGEYSFNGGTSFQPNNSLSGLVLKTYTLQVRNKTSSCLSGIASVPVEAPNVAAPTFSTLPEPSIINCPATPSFTTPKAQDFYGAPLTPTSTDKTTAGNCAGNYSVTRTWSATDGCGKTSTASQTITVIDNSKPVIAPLPAESSIDCPFSPVFAQATATDVCGIANLIFKDVTTLGNSPNAYTITRTWTATDGCQNSATATQIIHVKDMDQPYISTDGGSLIASSGASYQWYFGNTPINGETNQTFFPTTFGDYKVKVTNALGCSRFSEAVHSDVDFVDNCPQIHKNFGQACDDGNPNTTNDRVRNDCKCRGDYYSSAISVKCPKDMTVVSTDKYGTVITWNERDMFTGVSSLCTINNIDVQRTSGYYSGYPFPVNSLTYEEYIATDACGNKSSCSFYVRTTDIINAVSTLSTNRPAVGTDAIHRVSANQSFALYQNSPNPMDYSTYIGFNLPSEQIAKLTIVNMSGQIVYQKNINGRTGYNKIVIEKSELQVNGVLQYRLDTQDNSATKRMVVME